MESINTRGATRVNQLELVRCSERARVAILQHGISLTSANKTGQTGAEQQRTADLDVIHFTEGAAERLPGSPPGGAGLVSLIEGCGDIDVFCLHLSPDAELCDVSMTHDRTVLVLHGSLVAMAGPLSGARVDLAPGMGVVLKSGERFEVLECPEGAVLLLVEAQWLDASRVGMPAPGRVAGQRWPEEG